MSQDQDIQLINRIKKGEEGAFRALFDAYFKYLLVTVTNITGDRNLARDLSQEVFLTIWKKRETLNIQSNLKAYLRRAVVNKTLNYLKSKRLDYQEPQNLPEPKVAQISAQQNLEAADLQKIINEAIENLPTKCRTVFTLCRLEGLSHKEIASQLNISPKTVENQMTKALKILRLAVAPYLTTELIVLLFNYCVGF